MVRGACFLLLVGLAVGFSATLEDEFTALAAKVGDNVIKKLVEEGITDLIEHVMPSTVHLTNPENITKSVDVPIIGNVSVDLAFTGTELRELNNASTTFGNFTDTAVNVTILFGHTNIYTNSTGKICLKGECHKDSWTPVLRAPVSMKTMVTYKLKKVFGVPVGLEGTPCLGPALNASIGDATVSGFGDLDSIMTKVMNDALKEQHLFETPLVEAVNTALQAAEKGCNITSVQGNLLCRLAGVGCGH